MPIRGTQAGPSKAVRLVGTVVAAFSLLISAAPVQADSWKEISSPHFHVFTNGSQWDARHVALDFEQMRYVFALLFPNLRLDSGAPLEIFAVKDGATAQELQPQLWKKTHGLIGGDYRHGWEKEYVMVELDSSGMLPAFVYHEYTHSILHLNSEWLPTWLDEGLAEYYGYTRFAYNKIYVGAPTARIEALRTANIPVQTLIQLRESSSSFWKNSGKVDEFYAESWALVHYLIWGPGMGRGAKLDEFYQAIESGADQETAFQQDFGSFSDINQKLDQMMQKFQFESGVVSDPPDIKETDFHSRKLTKAEANAELAGFHLYDHDFNHARPLIEKALKEDPNLGLAHQANGFLLFSSGSDIDAQKEFAEAYSLDTYLYLSLFYKAMLSPQASSSSPADEAALETELTQVAALNSRFAPAYVQLALLYARRRNYQRALGLAIRAEELEPSRAGYHVLVGQILLHLGEDAQAAAEARLVAGHWFGPDHDEGVELWNEIPSAERPARVALGYDIPQFTSSASGIVKSVQCGTKTQPWVLVLDSEGRTLSFDAKGPITAGFTDTLWYGADHFSDCRHLDGLPAVVRYKTPAGGGYTGDAVELEIRDALSPIAAQTSDTPAANQASIGK